MSLFHSQTIFNILITLIICSAMFIFFRFKLRVLEVSQREQAKVLQSLVMSMRNGGHQRNAVSEDEIMKHVQMQMQMQMQQGGAGAGANAGGPSNQNRHPNDLIDVSDDDDDDDDDESESSSDSEEDDTDSSSSENEKEEKEENEENHENTTKKIIFNNGGALDTHAHPIEHLTGDDIKVIELTEPLYAVGAGSKHDNGNNVSDDDEQEDDNEDDDNEDMSDDDNDNDNDDEETSDDTEVKVQELPSHEQHLETSIIDTTEIKTIFKADKQQQQQQHSDYNSMNVQTLKQHLKTKLTAEGMHYNETAINKLNKKELIKHLTQG
jgi:hypothetical protein